MTKPLAVAILAAHHALQLQALVDSELVVSELDGAGVVNLEGTVDLHALVEAVLAAQTIADIDGPLPARPAGEVVRLIVTGSSTEATAKQLANLSAGFPATAAEQVEKALRSYWGLIDWKAAPVEPAA